MKLIQKIIQAGFATCALASASMPALSWTVWPDIDFEWYANVGKPPAGAVVADTRYPAPRAGYVWAPGHYVRTPTGDQQYVAGRWVADEYNQHVATLNVPTRTVVIEAPAVVATGPTVLTDRTGQPIPTNPGAYPVDSVRR